ncbi:tetratricopeptide repeat 33 [Paramuricea clavata]|uniref:Tetratricopeptide repeat 33 n=1 Tax=Paramuricea clavata TaxID=317549 RepID=A0A7D9EEP5_PARCT|nr:tetratricopeptide repeat 33 [Paramuricea clavata]
MKAQVLLELDEIFPAIQSAEMAVTLNPRSPNSLQTLGRGQIAIGEIEMAIISFSKALHITPDSEEIRNEDLCWAVDLRKEKNERQKNNESDTKE